MTLYAGLAGTLREPNVVHWNSYMPPTILCNVLPLFLNISLSRDSTIGYIRSKMSESTLENASIYICMWSILESLERLIFRNGGTR